VLFHEGILRFCGVKFNNRRGLSRLLSDNKGPILPVRQGREQAGVIKAHWLRDNLF